jgi:AraC-like DNA-binding protein
MMTASDMMSPQPARDPLARYQVLHSADPDAFRHAAVTTFGAIGVDTSHFDGTVSRANFVQLRSIGLGFSSCGIAAVSFAETGYARQQFALSGSGATTVAGERAVIDAQRACVTSAGRQARIDHGRNFRQLFLRIEQDALERTLTALLGGRPRGRLDFEATAVTGDPAVRGLMDLVWFLGNQLDRCPERLAPALRDELEQAIVVSFLCANRHSFSHLLQAEASDAAPAHVRRAEDYIEANWNQAVSIEQLSAITGVSTRALFRAFKRFRGYSPLTFAKRVRLSHAKRMLEQPGAAATVNAVAIDCAFGNGGHFARDYRAAFGEPPSQTLLRGRSAAAPPA